MSKARGKPGGVVGARAFEGPARFDLQRVVGAVAVGIDPFADRIARIGRLVVVGPVASVGEDATEVLRAADQNIGGLRRHHEFERRKCDGHERHAPGHAADGVVEEIALPAVRLVRHAVLENLSILRGQRGLLSEPPRFGLVERRLAAGRKTRSTITGVTRGVRRGPPRPCALPVRILRVVVRLNHPDHHQCGGNGNSTSRASQHHDYPPATSDPLIRRLFNLCRTNMRQHTPPALGRERQPRSAVGQKHDCDGSADASAFGMCTTRLFPRMRHLPRLDWIHRLLPAQHPCDVVVRLVVGLIMQLMARAPPD